MAEGHAGLDFHRLRDHSSSTSQAVSTSLQSLLTRVMGNLMTGTLPHKPGMEEKIVPVRFLDR